MLYQYPDIRDCSDHDVRLTMQGIRNSLLWLSLRFVAFEFFLLYAEVMCTRELLLTTYFTMLSKRPTRYTQHNNNPLDTGGNVLTTQRI